MSGTLLNRDFYAKLIDDDIAWLKEHTEPGLTQHHIIEVLKDSINQYYPPQPIPPSGVVKTNRKRLWR